MSHWKTGRAITVESNEVEIDLSAGAGGGGANGYWFRNHEPKATVLHVVAPPHPDDTALLQQALEQLEWADNAMPEGEPIQVANQKVITALRERLGAAQPTPKYEPAENEGSEA